MDSEVYLVRIPDWKNTTLVAEQFAQFLRSTPLLDGLGARELTAIKLTFGEAGNTGYPAPLLVARLACELSARGTRPFLTETNTLYSGRRKNTVDHLMLAHEHGFSAEMIGAPIVIGDGLRGRDGYAVELPGPRLRLAHLAPVVRDTDRLIGLAHVTGHLLTGMGGAIKNIGMGLANRTGKLAMHGGISPAVNAESCILCRRCAENCAAEAISFPEGVEAAAIDPELCTGCAECLAVCPSNAIRIDWKADSQDCQEKMAEYAAGIVRAVGGRAVFINLINRVTRHCDCLGDSEVISPDIGIAGSADPVALDQASLDLVRTAAGQDPFQAAWPESDPEDAIRHAAILGLGSRSYRLVER